MPFLVFRWDAAGVNAPPGERGDNLSYGLAFGRSYLFGRAQDVVVDDQGGAHGKISIRIRHQMRDAPKNNYLKNAHPGYHGKVTDYACPQHGCAE
jgi:hypothetical protein